MGISSAKINFPDWQGESKTIPAQPGYVARSEDFRGSFA
jgi:hypothetical protein